MKNAAKIAMVTGYQLQSSLQKDIFFVKQCTQHYLREGGNIKTFTSMGHAILEKL